MIPKKIHYCWFGKEEIPSPLQKCMATWKEFLPDYEVVLWNEKKFDVNSIPWTKEAQEARKYAFVSDYIRLYAIYNEGGIYMDTDVIVKKNFDCFLKNDFFTAIESYTPPPNATNIVYVHKNGDLALRIAGMAIMSSVFGAKANHPYIKDCLDWYENKHFILPDRSYFNKFTSNDIYATIAQKYGFRYKDEEQNLSGDMKIYPSSFIAQSIWNFNKDNFAIHCCAGSWNDKTLGSKLFGKYKFLRKLLKKREKVDDVYEFVQNSPIWK